MHVYMLMYTYITYMYNELSQVILVGTKAESHTSTVPVCSHRPSMKDAETEMRVIRM